VISDSEPIGNNDAAPNSSGESNVQNQNRNPGVAPTTPSSQLPPSHAHHKIACETEKDWWDKHKRWAELLGIILLAIYTGYTIKMYHANKESADAAKDAALAAKQSADTQENSFQMERRRAEDQEEAICRLRTDGMAALDHVGHVRVINSGKTKARNVEAHVDTYLADAITLKKLRDLGSVDISTSELSGNEQSLDRGINLLLTARDWQNLADTNQVIIDSGHVRYENGFGRVVDEPFCDGWWYFRTPEDKNNPIQGRGNECGQIPQNVAGVRKQKAK
jgi:hypothetical protein